MSRKRYIKKVTAYLERDLKNRKHQLPVELKIRSVHGAQSDWKLFLDLGPLESTDEWFDCEDLFKEMARSINDAFVKNKWYYGIVINVPLNFLGKLGAQAKLDRLQQEQDDSQYRSIRL